MKRVRLVLVGGFLGAGKTTTIAGLAHRMVARGQRVAVVTNDQGSALVDTVRVQSEGLAVREVTGACFCCRFDDLVERCHDLVAAEQPDVILAEPVGSCTDLAATVINPLRRLFGDRFSAGPLIALFQPTHGMAILKGGPGALPADVAYVLRKQLEEADAIAINRVDEIPFPLVDEIASLLSARFPGRPLLRTSAVTGQGLDALLALVDGLEGGSAPGIDVDYDRYARGEAALGWLNASSRVTGPVPFAAGPFVLGVVEEVQRRAAAAGAAIAHLKASAVTPEGVAVANAIDASRPPRLSVDAAPAAASAELTVNARVVADPEWLERAVRESLLAVADARGLKATWASAECFRPARPQPTHREPSAAAPPPKTARVSRRGFLQATSGAVVGAALARPAGAQTDAAKPSLDLLSTEPRTFTGPALGEIAFPLGGIGTGTVSLGGRGQLRDWEIFNRPGKGRALPGTFVAAWVKSADKPGRVRVLEAASRAPYPGSFGAFRDTGQGLAHLREAQMTGAYPIAEIAFTDPSLPVTFALEAFNPFIPHATDDSSLPVAIFRYGIENRSAAAVDVAIVFTIQNAVGYDGQATLLSDRFPGAGQNFARVRDEGSLAGLELLSSKHGPDSVRSGSMALATTARDYTTRRAWKSGRRDESYRNWLEELKATGRVADPQEPSPTPDGFTHTSSLAPRVTVAPGERKTVEFVLAWYFPLRQNDWDKDPKVQGTTLRNDYATRFAGAWDVAKHTVANLARLEAGTRAFRDALVSGTLPAPVVDAVSSQSSILRTNTCLLLEGKQFFGFEGVRDDQGCCPMNCTHVWNYEQALAVLFPDLERSMRRTDFLANLRADGSMAFRTLVPVGKAVWDFKPSADGQLGCILKLYREWQISGDDAFLKELWPRARKALEFAWQYWDADRDGVIEGEQHVTYDVEFYGANTMVGTLYLGALRAAERMAQAVGDTGAAAEYARVFASGRDRLDRELWRESYGYYVQRVPDKPKMAPTGQANTVGDNVAWHTPAVGPDGTVIYQYGDGCLADQLLGQWFSHVVGLGYLLPPDHVRAALRSVFRHNYREDFREYENTQRLFALDDEKGLLICSWPHGGRPPVPFRHWEEVWTGIEYQVAAHLIYEGEVEAGLTLVRAVRKRYDGERRNPWNEVECGSHYARALASWSLLTALSGFEWSAPERRLAFAPRLPGAFKSFFATGGAWGTVSLDGTATRLDVIHGELPLARLSVPGLIAGRRPAVRTKTGLVRAKVDGRELVFAPAIVVRAGDVLQVD